ncbi:MAG: purine-binding chemotaxis protein CheW [Agathobacter sp.]|nr:purine-binding chemotaxis protein CheW [Agathobacter sp.]MBQ6811753.1 purine-binding chemotaxis protein CheW [Agathobacter sp.]
MDERDTQKGKYVTFKSGDEYFGLKIQYVNEIIVFQEITKIPESENYIKGLINLRGKIIPVIDVRLRFKQEPFEYTDRTCIIVVNVKNIVVGLIVEQIAEVVEIQEENIIPSPSVGKADKSQNKYVYAIGKVGDQVKLLLDPDRLLNDEEITALDPNADSENEGEE